MKKLKNYLALLTLVLMQASPANVLAFEFPSTKMHLSAGVSQKDLIAITKDEMNPLHKGKPFVSGGFGYNLFGPVVMELELAYKNSCKLELLQDETSQVDFAAIYGKTSLDVISILGISGYASGGVGVGKFFPKTTLKHKLDLSRSDTIDLGYKIGGGIKVGFNNFLQLRAGYDYTYLGKFEKMLEKPRSDHTFSVGVIIF